jgi:hypothetical protein
MMVALALNKPQLAVALASANTYDDARADGSLHNVVLLAFVA